MINRRKEDRLRERNSVTIQSFSSTGANDKTNAYTYDLSVGGARIFSKELFDVGSILRIHLALDRTRQTVTVDGIVKWLNHRDDDDIFELGVEFRHQISHSIVSLIRHLYSADAGIPSSIA